MRQRENSQNRKCKFYGYKLQRQIQIINYNYFHPNVFSLGSLGFSFFNSNVSVAGLEHASVYWEGCRIRIVVLILKYLTQQRNTYSNSATETLKQDATFIKSYMISLLMSLLSILNRFQVLIYFFCYQL